MKIPFIKRATVNPIFNGISDNERAELTRFLKGSNILLLQLRKVLEKRILDTRHISSQDVDSPAYIQKRAFKDGQLQVLEELYSWLHTNEVTHDGSSKYRS